jgi:choline dehydrogenase-like flavoprotein
MTSSPHDADIVIIGSGPAGVSAAFPLVETGLRVLMIDGAGREAAGTRTAGEPWRKRLGDGLEALVPEDGLSPKLRTPAGRRIVGDFQRRASIEGDGFIAVGALARGGLSRLWGAFVCEFDADDLTGWPIALDDLRSSYRAVTERIGVSGSATDELSTFYGSSGALQPSLPPGPTAARLLACHDDRDAPDFALGLARSAILTADRAGRKACNLGKDCLWGCERGAVYDARFDLAALRRRAEFRLADQALAVRLTRCADGWEVSTQDGRRFSAPRIVMAAGALGTAPLVLPLLPDPSAELRLLSSPVMAMPLVMPARIGRSAPDRGYSLAQLGYRLRYGRREHDYVTGSVYELSYLPMPSFAGRLPLGRRAGMEVMSALAPALMVATAFFPGDCSDNRLAWQRQGNRSTVVVRGGFDAGLADKRGRVAQRLRRIWRRRGAWTLPGTTLAAPGTDVHYAGPFGMGLQRPHGTTRHGELHAAPGIHIVGAAAFPSLPSKHPTLTIMANADRIGRHLAALR